MLSHPHCPDTNLTLVDFLPTEDNDGYLEGYSIDGDYLVSFEEYRGFYIRGIHTRTCPWDKDFFVYSDLNDFGKRDLTTIMKRVIRQITPEEKKKQIEIATKNKDKKSIIVKKVKE